MAHEPKHYHLTGKKASDIPTKEGIADAHDSQSAPSSPSPRNASPSPHSPSSSTPNSPTHYSMASFKPSARNPQYYSIIRTRRSNVGDATGSGVGTSETGMKRARSSVTPGVSASPAKVMHLNSGEKLPVQQDDDVLSTSEASGRKKAKEGESKASSARSLSGSFDSSSSPIAVLSKSILGSNVMQEFNLRSSPITRSNAASMKMKTHEFISLPSRRKRGGKRGGLRGDGAKLNVSSEDNASEVGEDFDISAEMKSEELEEKMEEKSCSQDSDKTASSDTEKVQPPKRKRGRPPKVRRDTPTGSPAALGSSVTKSSSSPSLSAPLPSHASLVPISSSTRSSKPHGRGAGKESGSAKTENTDESPLPAKTDSTDKKVLQGKEAESRDKRAESHDKRAQSRDESADDPDPPAEVLTKSSRKSGKGIVPPPPSPTPTSPVSKDLTAGKLDAQGNKKHFTGTRSHSKRGAATTEQGDGETTTTTSRKKRKVSKTDISEADHQPSISGKSSERKSSVSDTVGFKEQSRPGSASSPTKEFRNKSKSKKSTPKSRTPSKSDKAERKKSVSETGDTERADVSSTAMKQEPEPEEKDVEAPMAQIALTEQRQSVFVSVLSGSDKRDSEATPTSEEQATISESSSKEGSSISEAASSQHRESQQRVSETSPVFPYPASPAPTPTYPQFPYHASFPPLPHMMYPPSGPPSTMYPFYGYPGTGHLSMQHPAHGAYYPHMAQPITTGDQIPLPQNMHPQTPYCQSLPSQSPTGDPSSSAPTSSVVLPPIITSTATTVGGVRVSVLDKPPTQLPMVTLPYHMPSAAAPRPLRPQPGGYPMEMPSPPGMRAFGGSPDGLEARHIHPLSQVYRPGMIGPYPPTHLPIPHHPSYHQGLRLDPSGMAYMDWAVSIIII